MLTVNRTVAVPLALVVLVALANEPPVPVLDQVTTLPAVDTELLNTSANCAVISMVVPADGVVLPAVTMYFVAAAGTVVKLAVVPVNAPVSVAVAVCAVPAVVLTVKETVAMPLAFVVLVALEKTPPPELDQVTTTPAVATALLPASAS